MISKEEFMKIAEKRYESVLALNDGRSFYDYEKEFARIMDEMSRELLEKNIGTVPTDKRKKKLSPYLGT